MKTLITTSVAIAIIVASGVVHGLISHRWSQSELELQQAVARLQQLPDEVGDWKFEQEFEIPERQLEIGEIDGYLSRTYVNRKAGKSVNVIIVCGQPGPIAVHTPDICFRGQGMRQMQQQQKVAIPDKEPQPAGEFWHCDFTKEDNSSSSGLRAYWGWAVDGGWSAPTNPRMVFAGQPYLYKMYVTQGVHLRPDDTAETDAAQEFLAAWLPHLKKVLLKHGAPGEPAAKLPADESLNRPAATATTTGISTNILSIRVQPERLRATVAVPFVERCGAAVWPLPVERSRLHCSLTPSLL